MPKIRYSSTSPGSGLAIRTTRATTERLREPTLNLAGDALECLEIDPRPIDDEHHAASSTNEAYAAIPAVADDVRFFAQPVDRAVGGPTVRVVPLWHYVERMEEIGVEAAPFPTPVRAA
jgi:hypothetical protein